MEPPSKKPFISAELEAVLRPYERQFFPQSASGFDLLLLVNGVGIVTYVSPSPSIMPVLGYAPEEIVGSHAGVLIHPDDLATLQRVSGARGKTLGRSLLADYRLRCKDGSWRWFEGGGTNLLQEPEIAAIVATFRQNSQEKLAPHLLWSKMEVSDHIVQFYETESFLVDEVSGFIETGLGVGDACMVIALPSHRAHLEKRLQANGLDKAVAHARGEYLSLDAGETLAKCMEDGLPVLERFTDVVGGLIAQVAKGRRHVRIFGEMVALLWAEGNQAASLRLEELWNELRGATPSFSLFCTYAMQGFAGEAHRAPLTAICHQHSQVIPAESYSALSSSNERLHAITLLQQQVLSLQAEIAERRAAEERRRISKDR